MKNTLIGVGLLLCMALYLAPATAQIQVRPGKSRPIPATLFGINGNITGFDAPFEHPEVTAAMKQVSVSLLRYPGGMIANHWNFETGGVDRSEPDADMQPWIVSNFKNTKRTFTVENYANGLKATGMAPLVVLNMLGKDLDHNLNVLRKLRDLGFPVRHVELGNELYFGLVKMKRVFPTPEDYGRTCQTWIGAIKKEFPDAQCAVIGYYVNGDARNTNWTKRVLSQCTNADAVTFHTYSALGLDGSIKQPDLGLVKEQTTRNPSATRIAPTDMAERQRWEIAQLTDSKAIANSLSRVQTSAGTIDELDSPATMPVWITEFNMRADDSAIRGTWLNALQISTFLTRFLKDPRVNVIMFHNIYSSLFGAVYQNEQELNYLLNEKLTSKPGQLTAGGLMMNLYAQAARNMTSATPMTFDNAPTLANDRNETVPGLIGWQFANGTQKRTLLVNQTAQNQVLGTDLMGTDRTGASVRFRQFHAPLATYVQGVESVKRTDGKTGRTVSLAPYSITIIN